MQEVDGPPPVKILSSRVCLEVDLDAGPHWPMLNDLLQSEGEFICVKGSITNLMKFWRLQS